MRMGKKEKNVCGNAMIVVDELIFHLTLSWQNYSRAALFWTITDLDPLTNCNRANFSLPVMMLLSGGNRKNLQEKVFISLITQYD